MTIREDVLPILADARHDIIDGVAGLRRYRVIIRRETPSDARGGIGATKTVVDVELTEKPRCKPAGDKDIVTSAGRLSQGDWVMDKITPRNDAGTAGTTLATLVPVPDPTAPGQKVFVILIGPGMPTNGGVFTPSTLDASGNFGFRIGLKPVSGKGPL